MALILFLYVMQAAIETLQSRLTCNKLNFKYFPIQKKQLKSPIQLSLASTRTTKTTKGNPFQVDNLLYIDNGACLFETLKELTTVSQIIYYHFMKFGLQMHVGMKKQKSKKEAKFYPPSLLEAEGKKDVPINLQQNNGEHSIQSMNKFKYLGSLTTPCLTLGMRIPVMRFQFPVIDIFLR